MSNRWSSAFNEYELGNFADMGPFTTEVEIFLILSRTLNISRAAELTGQKQSTLSKSLFRLEKSWGCRLFSRSKQGIQLTRDGERARDIFIKLKRDWELELRQHESSQTVGLVKLGCHPAIAQNTLDKILPVLLEENEGLQVELNFSKSLVVTRMVIDSELDMGLVIDPQRHPELVIYPLRRDAVSLWGQSKSRRSTATQRIYYNPEMLDVYSYLKGFPNHNKFPVQDYVTIASILSNSNGVGILPPMASVLVDGLTQLQVLAELKLCLIYRKDRSRNRIMQLAVNTIKSQMCRTVYSQKP